MSVPPILTPPMRTALVCRASARFCARLGWTPLTEMPLPNGRRADILALQPNGDFAVLEVKSCARDFLADAKWHAYREYCDRFYFAVDCDFPRDLLPEDAGLIVTDGATEAALLREAPAHALAPARRRALLQRYARLAAGRLAALADPAGAAELRAALSVE